ncbi:hypothetical protein [Shouchella miscanthi]|uniref:hypothetical protein n=1 Tax=Shouchella miscanthi TaxID=2598861 RepID=UPI00119DF8D4|nr:hypothetical protein [Shouchella miscanthi]
MEENKMIKYDTMLDTLSIVLTFYMGVTGIFFIFSDRGLFYQSETYKVMATLIPQYGWGILFLAAAVVLSIAVVAETKYQYLLFIAGGLMTTILLFLYALASFDAGTPSVLPYRYLAMSLFSAAIAVLGGIAWRTTRRLQEPK